MRAVIRHGCAGRGLTAGARAIARCSLGGVVALAACARPLPAPRPNVLLVTLDTTRADRLGAYGRIRAHTPRLDALARDGALFRRAYSSAPLTVPAHASLMTGLTPLRHGVRDNFGATLPRQAKTLAELFKDAGYDTAAVVGATVLDRGSGLERGFARYHDLSPLESGGEAGRVDRRGDDVVDRALPLLGEGPRPRFVWVHLYDAHWPYEAPDAHRLLHPDDPYAGELSWLDQQVGRLIDRIDELGGRGWCLAVTADHGEGLGDHGEVDHGVFVYDSTLHVPLVIHAPARVVPRSVDATVRDVDLAPTLLDLAGIRPPEGLDGRSLRPLLEGRPDSERPAYAESYYARLHYGWSPLRVLRGARYKLIDGPRPELYDTRFDPAETRDLAAQRPAEVATMRARLARLAQEGPVDPAPMAVAPGALERLRSLGYAGAALTTDGHGAWPDPKSKRAALPYLFEAATRSLSLIEGGRPAEALVLLDAALSAEPRYVDGHALRGEALYALERFAEAATAFERAFTLNPQSAEMAHDLARAQAAHGDLDAASRTLARGEALATGDGRFAAARERLREARRSAERPDPP